MLTGYADLYRLQEDQRIEVIGKYLRENPDQVVAFYTDDEEGKADRYIRKLITLYPRVRVVDRFNGPVPNVVTVRVIMKKEWS